MFNKILDKLKAFDLFQVKEDESGVRYVNTMVRALTTVLDVILIALIVHLISFILNTFIFNINLSLEHLDKFFSSNNDLNESDTYQVVKYISIWIIQQIAIFSALFIFIVHMWYRSGMTPVRYLFGIRIVDADTFNLITKKQAYKRLISVPLSLLPLGLGLLWSNFDKRGQAFHDKIANTVVVMDYTRRANMIKENKK